MCFKVYIQRIKQKFTRNGKANDDATTNIMMTIMMDDEKTNDGDDCIDYNIDKHKKEYFDKIMAIYYTEPERVKKRKQILIQQTNDTLNEDGI